MRWILGGPATLIGSLLSMASMPLFLPEGPAGVDHLVFPIVLFPAVWAALFLYASLEGNLRRGAALFTGLIVAQSLLVASAFVGG
ncbi:MAG: hypothetical protein AAGI70_13840 [Pseudomonadota bacterium]